MCEPGGQLADDSTADEHLRRLATAGRPYAIWWALAVFSPQLLPCAAISRWLLPPALLPWTGRTLAGRMLAARHAITWILNSFPKVAPSRGRTTRLTRVPATGAGVPKGETREFRSRFVATRVYRHRATRDTGLNRL